MSTLFISDLHLEADRPDIATQFFAFLDEEAVQAEALYVLGDLFESWVGDDDPNPHYAEVKAALRALSDHGVPTYFMHGNRDFMVGERFAAETGMTILTDPVTVTLYGRDVLLSHGDAYCTDDHEYQAMRRMTRDPQWQAMMLDKPLEERLEIAAGARAASKARYGTIDDEITDVNQGAIESALRDAGVDTMLHGHTHRPAVHEFELDGNEATRIVLGDWYDQGSVVRWNENGFELSAMPR